jgi:hypothetical protein
VVRTSNTVAGVEHVLILEMILKVRLIPKPTKELETKCDADNQFDQFDRLFRSVISVPKAAVLKEEAKQKRRKKKQARG